ncbi:MAG: hypothetical protein EKK52_06740 [Burkholderiales bacterium]|nr:MAG: hypothetical protein EKK52_06740 [Burkholderiales bacterium]
MAAARWAWVGALPWKARPLAVALAGATTVTLVTLVMWFTTVVLWLSILVCTRMPTLVTGGALMTTAGGVPSGAGTTRPGREPGGGGTKTPSGPMGRGPPPTPISTDSRRLGGGGTKATPRASQKPGTNTTTPSRCS